MKPTSSSIGFPANHARWEQIQFDTNGGCWLWDGYISPSGYGRFFIGSAGVYAMQAHRAFWERHNGPIPSGALVCHKCDVRACVNPNHMFLGSSDANMQDMVRKDRSCHGERHQLSKLTQDQVKAIFSDTRICREIAADYGVTHQSIFDIKAGKSWWRVTGKIYERSSRQSRPPRPRP